MQSHSRKQAHPGSKNCRQSVFKVVQPVIWPGLGEAVQIRWLLLVRVLTIHDAFCDDLFNVYFVLATVRSDDVALTDVNMINSAFTTDAVAIWRRTLRREANLPTQFSSRPNSRPLAWYNIFELNSISLDKSKLDLGMSSSNDTTISFRGYAAANRPRSAELQGNPSYDPTSPEYDQMGARQANALTSSQPHVASDQSMASGNMQSRSTTDSATMGTHEGHDLHATPVVGRSVDETLSRPVGNQKLFDKERINEGGAV
ncbi:hypothetical protein SeLEV6574_g04152 [Synchytrium endobioticum]|uniref:Uncharacterized protein n=1 Tax=Synchytrium endobioticum TaxID=286115 RepID=A0A507D0K8_9FUNG|nr:hypothetical protein SeLEV6574_g04152 [Synchytrium endobioticum]